MKLTEFLLARIAEDEHHARKLAESDRRPILALAITLDHPRRILSECESRRRIVELHEVSVEWTWVTPFDGPAYREASVSCEVCGWAAEGESSGCDTLRALALPYADHPDFDESWRP